MCCPCLSLLPWQHVRRRSSISAENSFCSALLCVLSSDKLSDAWLCFSDWTSCHTLYFTVSPAPAETQPRRHSPSHLLLMRRNHFHPDAVDGSQQWPVPEKEKSHYNTSPRTKKGSEEKSFTAKSQQVTWFFKVMSSSKG